MVNNADPVYIPENQPSECLVLQGISKKFGGLQAVSKVNLGVKQGERLAILGPNGAGKTTLFNMISGEFPPTEGKILLYGEDVTELPNYKRVYKGLARTYQITELFFEMSVLENTVLALMGTRPVKFSMLSILKGKKDLYQEAEEFLNRVGLVEKKDENIKNLSYGDQRLVELVLALASKPRILALDEPTAGLSVAESRMMVNALQKLEKDITFLLIEHDMDVAFEIVDRIMVLHEGQVVTIDTKEKVRNNERVQQIYLGVGE